jgi:hypothetical protein
MRFFLTLSIFCVFLTFSSFADEALSSVEISKKLQNPVANMISVPIQANYDQNIGLLDQGDKWVTNIQPVIPISLNKDWNIISRTILPVISQDFGSFSKSGIGDIVQSVFFSPVEPTSSGWIWGAGPVLLLPTASDDLLGQDNWGIGPTAVVLKQQNSWTYGALFNHIWGFGSDSNHSDVNATYFQPFIAHNWPTATSVGLNIETTIDWENDVELIPVNLTVGQVLKLGSQVFSVQAGVRYWLSSPDSGPEGVGYRLQLTWLIPK